MYANHLQVCGLAKRLLPVKCIQKGTALFVASHWLSQVIFAPHQLKVLKQVIGPANLFALVHPDTTTYPATHRLCLCCGPDECLSHTVVTISNMLV